MLFTQPLDAGIPQDLTIGGLFFLLDSTGVEASITVTLLRRGSPIFGAIPGAKRGLKLGVNNGFDGVRLEAAGACTVRFFASFENVEISTTDGSEVTIPGGVEINQQGVTVAGASYVVPAAGIAVSTAANAARRAIHFRNTHATLDCYLAAFAAAAKADCPIVIGPGECLMIDDRSAAAAWVAFSDGADLTLKSQQVTE